MRERDIWGGGGGVETVAEDHYMLIEVNKSIEKYLFSPGQ